MKNSLHSELWPDLARVKCENGASHEVVMKALTSLKLGEKSRG